ncbi:MAG: patatin-like phospholipase family protein [Bacteroidetes bacterium]|nr:patatin-like phospholipase family protein [Bacteroidota bacterium]
MTTEVARFMNIQKPFVLSGGGARGFAHLGVIKALEEQHIVPSEISGTSAGAVVGAFIASGYTVEEIKEMFIGKLKFNLLAWNSFHLGLISMKKISEFIEKNLPYKTFDQLKMPLYITATNFINGRQHIFTEGKLIDAITAASAIPAIFPPVYINDVPYVDGGLANNLPIEPFENRRSEMVCVYVNPIKDFNPKESILEVMDRAVHLSFREIISRSAAGSYLYIEPQDLQKFGMFEVNKLAEMYTIGYEYTKGLYEKRD